MKKIKARLQRIADRLTGRKADLFKSRRRHKVWREHAEELDRKATKRKNHGHSLRAAALERRAKRAHVKAIYWKGRVRTEHDAVNKLESLSAHIEHELNDWIETHGIVFEGHNKIRGGTYEQRAIAAQMAAMRNYQNGTRCLGPEYYSMEGAARDYAHTLYHYPQGHINDCSTYADGTCFVTGDPSPSGPHGYTLGGYTATELEHCARVTGKIKAGDLVVFLRYRGDRVGHHVERVLNPKLKQTTGHGDSAVNIGCNGSWDLFGDGLYEIVRPPRHKGD